MSQTERQTLNGGESVSIRCAYCLDQVTIFIHPSILEKYGEDYAPTRCAACDYLKTRRLQSLDETRPVASPRYATEAEIDSALESLND